jgi:predicted RNase H-like nuclease (RuvC/YqgF family)
MWKYIGYAGIILPVLGATYGGLQIASNLENQLDMNTKMAEHAHERIGSIEDSIKFKEEKNKMDLENELEKLGFKIDNNKSTVGYQIEDFQRELLQVQKQLTMLEGITQSLEKKQYEYASTTQVDGLRELIYQQKDKIMLLENPTDSGINYQQIIFDMQNQIQDINRRIDEHHNGNWN